jgi:hypothetical protein
MRRAAEVDQSEPGKRCSESGHRRQTRKAKEHGSMRRHFVSSRVLAVLTLVALLAAAAPAAARNSNPQVIPPHANAHGQSYGEWAVAWYEWAFAQDFVPVTDPTGKDCADGQSGKVWFLAGTFPDNPPSPVTRKCTIPTGKAILIPIVNVVFSNHGEDPPYDVAGLKAQCEAAIDTAFNLAADIDGRAVANIAKYQVTPTLFPHGLTIDGDTEDAASCGIYLLLPPLSKGDHTVHIHGGLHLFDFELDVTYLLTMGKK